MKSNELLKHLRLHGCYLKREGRAHSLWTNPNTGRIEAIPRHQEIADKLAIKICRSLSIPDIK
jgi:predicted RNA binding protein YcfA (HicA-like mRNA interferase family)